jgi:hypothetical protein
MLGMDCEIMRWGRGAIITAGLECVQMAVGSRLHTAGMVEGKTTVGWAA